MRVVRQGQVARVDRVDVEVHDQASTVAQASERLPRGAGGIPAHHVIRIPPQARLVPEHLLAERLRIGLVDPEQDETGG